jgi:hypothetical protein
MCEDDFWGETCRNAVAPLAATMRGRVEFRKRLAGDRLESVQIYTTCPII